MVLALILVSLLWLAVFGVAWWWFRPQVSEAHQVVDELDGFVAHDVAPRRVAKPVMEAVIEAKAHFGELRANNANRIIVGEFIRKWFATECPDMRKVDIVKHYPLAVELALTPLESTVAAQQYSNDGFVQRRRAAVNLPK